MTTRCVGFGVICAHDGAFSTCQTGGFDDNWWFQFGGKGPGFTRIIKYPEACGGNATFFHQSLGKRLGGFETGGSGNGPEDREPQGDECICQTVSKRLLRPDHCKVDRFGLGESGQPRQIAGTNRHVDTVLCRARIARRAVDRGTRSVAGEFSNQCVLSAATSDNEEIHANRMTKMARPRQTAERAGETASRSSPS